MTDGQSLEDTYGATLGRIKAQGSQKARLGVTALMWVCHSERPLAAEELCHALAVEIGATDCNSGNVSSIRTVLSCCQGLIMVDKEGSTVRLIHHSLQEYLTSHRNPFLSPHSTIAETCLTYLNSQQVMGVSGSPVSRAQHLPFLKYSSLYWGAHMKKDPSDRGKMLALALFSSYKGHISIKLLVGHLLPSRLVPCIQDYCEFTGLHCASIFGLIELVRTLAMMDSVDINAMDEAGATPFLWAARSGQEAVVKLLLGRKDINPDKPGPFGRTPLLSAAENGHEAVVKLLLRREDVNPDTPDFGGQTLITYAAKNGHEAMVKLLLEREDVNPDKADTFGQTPLLFAAKNGHEAVVKLLLGRKDVKPNTLDRRSRTPITWAAENGHEAVVKLLLGRKDVNPDRPGRHGRTAISWAAGYGREAVVKLLLAREDVNPDMPDNLWRTPISWAAVNGRESVVKLLLGREDVNPDKPDDLGRTPISWAAANRDEAIMKLLQEWRGVNTQDP